MEIFKTLKFKMLNRFIFRLHRIDWLCLFSCKFHNIFRVCEICKCRVWTKSNKFIVLICKSQNSYFLKVVVWKRVWNYIFAEIIFKNDLMWFVIYQESCKSIQMRNGTMSLMLNETFKVVNIFFVCESFFISIDLICQYFIGCNQNQVNIMFLHL